MKITRTHIAILVLLGLAAAFGQRLQTRLGNPAQIAFEPIEGLPGWRRVAFEAVSLAAGSATGAVFIGIGAEDGPEPLSPQALCTLLYPDPAPLTKQRAAYFTDINCPNCQSLELKLGARPDTLHLNRIELPLLGPRSEDWARLMLALELQGGTEAFQRQQRNGDAARNLTATALLQAERAGLDVERLLSDMTGPEVDARLATNLAAGKALGVWGTPALTIGTTLVLGDLRSEVLDRLIELEAERTAGGC